jgi:two-component system NtrC family response regulator
MKPLLEFEGMMGASPSMHGVFTAIEKVAGSSAPVLILGESGTGKELAATAIHVRGEHSAGPFVALNCNAIPESLLESELFGHERGAFTGAHAQRKGLIESAAGGTLFMDEVGDLPPSLQVKLLRFLQEKTFQRVGGRTSIRAESRVITATHIDLREAVNAGRFREDLFFRIAVLIIKLPPLRDRGDDILDLSEAFLHKMAAHSERGPVSFSRDALQALSRHTWPGNIRELQNRVRRAVIMSDGPLIKAADLDLDEAVEQPKESLRQAREKLEREMIRKALERSGGKISAAAAELGVSRPTFYGLMERLGVGKAPDRRAQPA